MIFLIAEKCRDFIVSAFLRPTYMMANHYVDYVHGQIAGRFKNTGLKKHDSMWKAVGALSHEMLRMFDKYGLSIPIPTNLKKRIPSLTRLLLPEKKMIIRGCCSKNHISPRQ